MSAAGVLDRVERLCREPLSPKVLRQRAVEVVRRAVPFDAYVWLLTDPVTCVGTSPLADVPMLEWPRLPELSRQRYLTTVNRWTDPSATRASACPPWPASPVQSSIARASVAEAAS